jgi:hypothetical protein
MPGKAEMEDVVGAHRDSTLEVESFDSVGQMDAAQGLGCRALHPDRIKMRSG